MVGCIYFSFKVGFISFAAAGDGEGELTLADGDVVQIIERVGNEWLRGQHRGRQGIFPSSFVEIVEDLPLESSTYGQISSNRVSALFDFDGKDGELIFKVIYIKKCNYFIFIHEYVIFIQSIVFPI